MRTPILLALLVAFPPSAQQPSTSPRSATVENEAPRLRVWQSYRVKQQGGGLGIYIDEAVVFHEIGQGSGRIWVLERRRRDQQMLDVTSRYDWVDGRACPALETVIAGIGRLPPIAMAGLDTEPGGGFSDVSEVTLIGPPARGAARDLVVRRDTMGPVYRWWQASLKALETCWKPRMPIVPGAYDLHPKLGTARDEVEVMRPY